MPAARRNRRGFSAEKESHPFRQIKTSARRAEVFFIQWDPKDSGLVFRKSLIQPFIKALSFCTEYVILMTVDKNAFTEANEK